MGVARGGVAGDHGVVVASALSASWFGSRVLVLAIRLLLHVGSSSMVPIVALVRT